MTNQHFYFPEQFKAAIFDMDGTILDSMHMWKNIDRRFLEKRGIPYTEDYGQAMKGRSYAEGAEYTIQTYGLKDTVEMLIQEWNDMALEEYRLHLLIKPGVREYLQELKQRGIIMALATVSSKEFYTAALTRNRVYSYFDFMTDASVVSRGKQFPDLFEYVAARIHVQPSECLVFEDSLHSIHGAHSGGFSTCGVYDESSSMNWDEITAAADYFMKDFSFGPQKKA